MAVYYVLLFYIVCLGYQPILAQNVTFDTQITLTVVDPDLIGTTESDKVTDPHNTGSYLFKANGNDDKRALTLNILIRDFKSSDSLYFRVHPTFIKCIQAAMTILRNADKAVYVENGFKTTNDIGSLNDYHRTGAGIELKFKSGVTADLNDIITAVLKSCPVPMMKIQRDIGITKLTDSVHIHMKGADHTSGPTFVDLDGGYNQYEHIGAGLDPQGSPDCSSITPVSSGNYYPSGYSDPVAVVGAVDEPIDNSMTLDAGRLVQYLGDNVEFSSCVPYTANSLNERCAVRTMTKRMYNVVKSLQKMVKNEMSDTLKITEAWDNSGTNPSDLRSEGRAIRVQLKTTNDASTLQTLSKYAICANVDYVAHEGTSLLLAVKKMKGDIATKIQFKNIQLIGVQPPSSKEQYYALSSEFKPSEIDTKYALFDSNGREDIVLNENATVSMFMSQDPEFRYFRLDPRIVQCYSDIVYNENKNLEEGQAVEVEVIRGFLSNPEETALMDIADFRYGTHTLGVAMQIRYINGTGPDYTPQRLAQKAVEQCAPIFDLAEEHVGIAIYKDSVFVDIRDQFEIWVDDDNIPQGYTFDTYDAFLEERAELAKKFRIVDPDDLSEACSLAHPPKKQSITYEYTEPEISKRKKRRRRATSDTCVPTYSTTHCSLVFNHLKEEVDEVWTETNRKWIYRNATEVKEALDNCLGICGTCLEGDIFDLKLKHCNNLLHWLPFELMNDDSDITNFYARDNLNTRGHACNGGEHCLEKAPLFSILMPSMKRLYRPDPTKSVKEMIYASEENPSPVLQILDELYAVHAKGIVKFWVADETDMVSMKKPLQVAMLYNKDVTKIHIYVMNSISKEPVSGIVESYVKEFATTGCPKYTRDTVAEFEVMDPPHSVTKRSLSSRHDNKNKLIREQMNWEFNGLRGP